MKEAIKNIFSILNNGKKQKLWLLCVADICISVLPISFLLALLYVINFYTQPLHTGSAVSFLKPVFSQQPVLFIIVFFLLFTIKNTAGFAVSKMQYHFVYDIASHIAGEKLMQYTYGSYHNFITKSCKQHSQRPVDLPKLFFSTPFDIA